MKNGKFLFFSVVVIILLLGVGLSLSADWVNCSGPFPGTCTQGGCRDPKSAGGCSLKGCVGGDQPCTYPIVT